MHSSNGHCLVCTCCEVTRKTDSLAHRWTQAFTASSQPPPLVTCPGMRRLPAARPATAPKASSAVAVASAGVLQPRHQPASLLWRDAAAPWAADACRGRGDGRGWSAARHGAWAPLPGSGGLQSALLWSGKQWHAGSGWPLGMTHLVQSMLHSNSAEVHVAVA
jgi:hypothetical protein